MEGQKAFVNAAKRMRSSPLPECGQGSSSASSSGCPIVGEGAGDSRQADCPLLLDGFSLTDIHSEGRAADGASLNDTGWMYPTERMFYEAMKRRGWHPKLQDLQAVVTIHSPASERAWSEILAWERMHCNKCKDYKLKSYSVRSQLSLKGRLLQTVGYSSPFDRQDWVISRCGREIRYVVDYYNAAPLADMPVALQLDVRPALDSLGAIYDRLRAPLLAHGPS